MGRFFLSLVTGWLVVSLIAVGCGDPFRGGGGGAGGTQVSCTTESDCPGVDDACKQRLCSGSVCTFSYSQSGASCTTGFCDGAGECVECVDDTMCGGELCIQGLCVPENCVDGEISGDESDVDCGGSCPPCDNDSSCNGPADCASYVCDQGTCRGCQSDEECPADRWCDRSINECQPKLVDGESCGDANAMCASNFCRDGVCCNASCDGSCMACSEGKTQLPNGQCQPVVVDTDPDGDCDVEDVASCGKTGECDGNGACKLHASGTVCDEPACQTGSLVSGTCDGAGTCAPDTDDCGLYVCEGAQCLNSCADSGDCDIVCNSGNNTCLACGQNPPAMSAACPAICGNNCAGGQCVISCSGADCLNTAVNCPPGLPCVIDCTASAGVCQQATVNCPADHACSLMCNGALGDLCKGANLNCGNGTCEVSCGVGIQSCQNLQVNCGANTCGASCLSAVDPPAVHCGNACSCAGC